MRPLIFIFISLVARASVSVATAVQGFTYAGNGDNGQGKVETDFQTQFTIAKALPGTNNAFTSARIYTNIVSYVFIFYLRLFSVPIGVAQ